MQDLTFVIGQDRAVAELWEALGKASIQMEASCTFPRLEGRVVHITVTDGVADAAYEALRSSGFLPMDRRPVIIADFSPEPGAMGKIARKLADAGVKVYIMYMATGDRVVIGASDLDKVTEALSIDQG